MNNNHGRRRTRRVRQQRKQQKTQIGRILLTVGLMALIAVVSIGGTIAWLTAETEAVTNTFSTSNIGIKLQETDLDDDTYLPKEDVLQPVDGKGDIAINNYKIVPGRKYMKDPVVTVNANSEPAWLFVVIDEKNNCEVTLGDDGKVTEYKTKYIDYILNNEGWTTYSQSADGDSVKTILYRNVPTGNMEQKWYLLKGQEGGEDTFGNSIDDGVITIKDTLKKETIAALTDANAPELKFAAYAIQQEGFTYEQAWNKIQELVANNDM